MECVDTIGTDELALYLFSAVAAVVAYLCTLMR